METHRNFKRPSRLIWEKPVFVTRGVTCPDENVIYVKHALHGQKRTREQATRESWTQKNSALVFINEEHSSPGCNKSQGIRRYGDNLRGNRKTTYARILFFLNRYECIWNHLYVVFCANETILKSTSQLMYIRMFYCFMKCCMNSTVKTFIWFEVHRNVCFKSTLGWLCTAWHDRDCRHITYNKHT